MGAISSHQEPKKDILQSMTFQVGIDNEVVSQGGNHGWTGFLCQTLSCLCDWLSKWLHLGVGETDEEVAKRLQASFDTEAGTDSHAAVRAGARPSQAVPPTLHTQTSGTAPVIHLASLTLVQHAYFPEHSGGCSHCPSQYASNIDRLCRPDRGRCNLGHTQQFKCSTAAAMRLLLLGLVLQAVPLHPSKLCSEPCPVDDIACTVAALKGF